MEIFVTENDEATIKGIYDYLTGSADTMPSDAESMLHRFLKNIEFMHKAEAHDKSLQTRGESKEIWYDIPMTLHLPKKKVSLNAEYQVSNLGRVRYKRTKYIKSDFLRNNVSKTYCVSLQYYDDKNYVHEISVSVDKLVYAACTGRWDILSIHMRNMFEYLDGDSSNHAFNNLKLIKEC